MVLALRAALGAGESIEIRLALADRLLALGDAARALVEYEHALRLAPTSEAALAGACRAAEASGDTAKANGYRIAAGAAQPASRAGVPTAGLQSAGLPIAGLPSSGLPSASLPGSGLPGSILSGGGLPGDSPPEGREAPILRLVPRAAPEPPASEPVITFGDVGGMDGVKLQLERAFLAPLRNPEVYRSFGRTIRGGLVLFGPPGCGKTFIARALAGEIGAKFFDIGLSDVLDMWFGESERKLHTLFENARRAPPAVIFLDEVDALGQRRSQLKGAAGRTLVNQLLAELDGFAARNTGVFVLGATNHPWDLDPALRRPGRFDQLMFVPPPDGAARKRILELKLAGRPTAPGLELGKAVTASDGFSGADLQALVDRATDAAIERSLQSGKHVPIDDASLVRAARELKPSVRAWLESARNYAVYANEGGMLDDLLAYLKKVGMA